MRDVTAAVIPRRALARPLAAAAFVAAGVVLLAAGALGFVDPVISAGAVILLGAGAIGGRWILEWHRLIALIVIVVLLIPIRRYGFAGNLPFQLEPYRVLVAAFVGAWALSLLLDPRVAARRSGLEKPFALLVVAVLTSIVANPDRVSATSSFVVKACMFLASFVLLYYAVVSLVRSRTVIDTFLKILVLGGVVLSVATVIEVRTGYNPFNHLQGWIPGLRLDQLPPVPDRGGRLRAYASAQHPIALSALMAMLVPIGVYLTRRTGKRVWLLALIIIFVGIAATTSRTGILMLGVVGLMFLWLRPVETKRMWPALIPALVAVQLVIPGTLGSLKGAFFPAGGLIASEDQNAGWQGSGRVADLGPSLSEWSRQPLFGQGFGTRVTDPALPQHNALILDDQWLYTLLEIGVLGTAAWLWIFFALVRKLGRAAKQDASDDGWLMAALAASIASFAVGMFTFDAFSFVQVTFVAIFLCALGAVVPGLRSKDGEASPWTVRLGPGNSSDPATPEWRRSSWGPPSRPRDPTRPAAIHSPAGPTVASATESGLLAE